MLKKLTVVYSLWSDSDAGCENSKFLVVPDWFSNDYCRVLELVQT
jgi:hypothetical protein